MPSLSEKQTYQTSLNWRQAWNRDVCSPPSLRILPWLDHERNHQNQMIGNQLYHDENAGRSRFCGWNSPAITQTPWYARKKPTILQIQQKRLSLNINNAKTKVMKINAQSEEHITLGGTNIESVSDFVYRGSKITTDGDSMADVLARILKATGA